ncbi:hypothetical protein DVA67_031770 [Solirubrobacter sp. CPCC 204708]|uniref:Topo IIA-type catalytic domain-containing protein n=1 Tax=Solirubrobacter deserti TaxID=2282478 RepID=A0ABT4RQF1_9ACTN|nr:DNA gyrase subunit A [Solirubrobacter deserti]MBE2320581.1 hypothetical protein [Solirubrobacter deserti]MDA0140790.1 hypothetical protein [Solirubrobacter deserti]
MIPDLSDGLDAFRRGRLERLGDRYVQASTIVPTDEQWDAFVPLAQDWRTRYPLVDGLGNLGSVDDDPPAEARYVEVRRTPLAARLPRFPNLLVNGSDTIPGHNLAEVCAAIRAVATDPSIDLDGIMDRLPGPDFATGGVVRGDLREIYATGAGTLCLRARAHVEEREIVFTELPYGVCKGGEHGVIREIVDAVAARRISGVSDVQDWTHREGMQLVVMTAPRGDTLALLQDLYRETRLETEYAVDLTARVDGEPRRFTLRELIDAYLDEHGPAGLEALAHEHGDPRRSLLKPSA